MIRYENEFVGTANQAGDTFVGVMLLVLLTLFSSYIAFLVFKITYRMREFKES